MTDIAITADAEQQASFSWKWFLFSFKGRITRKQYWLRFVLLSTLLSVVIGVGVVFTVLPGAGASNAQIAAAMDTANWISIPFNLLYLWTNWAVCAKRLHDRDKSGWWQLLVLIPIIGWIWLLVVIGFLRGTPGPNRFGPDPLAP